MISAAIATKIYTYKEFGAESNIHGSYALVVVTYPLEKFHFTYTPDAELVLSSVIY